jgi:diguanylate cyclase (GGDEF)-like protein
VEECSGVTIARFVVLTALYVLATWYAEAFIHTPAQVTLFWPAAGIAFAAVLRYGWRGSVFIPVAVLIAHIIFAHVPESFLPFSVASNLVGSLAAWQIVRWTGVKPDLTLKSGFSLLPAAMTMVLVSAAIGTTGLVTSGMMPAAFVVPAFLKWSMGDLLGIVCISPSMLILTAPASASPNLPRGSDYARRGEKLIWSLALVLAFYLVYWGGQQNSAYALGMAALPLAFLLWSAFRFEPLWTTLGASASIFFLTTMTGVGLAGFTPPKGTLDNVLLLGFMILFGSIPLVLGASVQQQRVTARWQLNRAAREAEQRRVELEAQVSERTLQLNDANALLEAANQRLETVSQTDQLTGLRNRRYLISQIPADLSFYDREQVRTGRSDHALLFALVDIDHFKRINDTYGHKAGDELLQQFSARMTRLVRHGDYVVRWGGEEFLLVFRPIPREFVATLGERIRQCVANEAFDVGQPVSVTASIGLAEYPLFRTGAQQLGWEQMLELADAALYWVKQNGRDGWAALRPTAQTDTSTLVDKLRLGAQGLVDGGQLEVLSSRARAAV